MFDETSACEGGSENSFAVPPEALTDGISNALA